MGVCIMNHSLCEFIMCQRTAMAITVVLLGFSGGVLALFVRGMHGHQVIGMVESYLEHRFRITKEMLL